MIFLQPFILWALPLMALPVVIHLLNRLRYRSLEWGAMQFLLSATRQSTRHERLREWLLLACRMLAIACVILAVSRPQIGGWLGLQLGGAPDTVVVLVDRSASMGAVDRTTRAQLLPRALKRVGEALKGMGTRHVVVIDSQEKLPILVESPARLGELPGLDATNGGADIPAMFEEAVRFLRDHPGSRTELWVVSDLQAASWQPEGERWAEIGNALAEDRRNVLLRLAPIDPGLATNVAVRVEDVDTRLVGGVRQLSFTLEVDGAAGRSGTIPLQLVLDGTESRIEMELKNGVARQREVRNLGEKQSKGWGALRLPADTNPQDNLAFFVYGEAAPALAIIVAEDAGAAAILQLASAPPGARTDRSAKWYKPEEAASLSLDDVSLLIWQGAIPPAQLTGRLELFLEAGGQLLLFPGDGEGAGDLLGMGWGSLHEKEPVQVTSWNEESGVLGATASGDSLPVDTVASERWREIRGAAQAVAELPGGHPFLVSRAVGQGALYACATLPTARWSSLGEGPVLVPLVQRLMQAGAARFSGVRQADVGSEVWDLVGRQMHPVYPADAGAPSRTAGVWQVENTMLSLNVPAGELRPDRCSVEDLTKLLGPVPVRLWEARDGSERSLQTELTPLFWLLVVAAMLVEGLLTLPARERRMT